METETQIENIKTAMLGRVDAMERLVEHYKEDVVREYAWSSVLSKFHPSEAARLDYRDRAWVLQLRAPHQMELARQLADWIGNDILNSGDFHNHNELGYFKPKSYYLFYEHNDCVYFLTGADKDKEPPYAPFSWKFSKAQPFIKGQAKRVIEETRNDYERKLQSCSDDAYIVKRAKTCEKENKAPKLTLEDVRGRKSE